MRKAVTAAIVYIGFVFVIAGSASVHLSPLSLLAWWHHEANQMAQCPGSALGYWCSVEPQNQPNGLRLTALGK